MRAPHDPSPHARTAPAARRGRAAPLWFLLGAVTLAGCQPDPDATTLFQDVGMSFEPCNEAEIRNKNRLYDLMPALKVCGSNNVAHYAWNPSGTHLYFDLTLSGNVLDASQGHKPLQSLPIDQPTGQPAWVNDNRIAIPIVPDPKDDKARERIALYDIAQFVLELKRVPDLVGITDLARGPDPNTLYLTAMGADGVRTVYSYDLGKGTAERAFPWLKGPVDSMTYTWQAERLVLGTNGQLTVYTPDGTALGTYAGKRGTIAPGGDWLAIERDGDEVSVFYQRSWEGMSRREREIAERKAKRLGDRFPDWYPKTVKLPTIEFVHLPTGKRGESRSFYGTRFQWYEREPYWGSFLLWGYEGKQLNTNVQLGNLRLRMGAIEQGSDAIQDVRLLPDAAPLPAPGGDTDAPETDGSAPVSPSAGSDEDPSETPSAPSGRLQDGD